MDLREKELSLQGGLGRHRLVMALLLALLGLEMLSLPWCAPAYQSDDRSIGASVEITTGTTAVPVLRISDIDGPRIDDVAATAVVEEPARVSAPATLPTGIWIFLCLAYVALLAFNLIVGYRQSAGTDIQWRWELIQTALFLIGWTIWDGYASAPWFPIALLKMGLILFVAYLVLLDRRKRSLEGA